MKRIGMKQGRLRQAMCCLVAIGSGLMLVLGAGCDPGGSGADDPGYVGNWFQSGEDGDSLFMAMTEFTMHLVEEFAELDNVRKCESNVDFSEVEDLGDGEYLYETTEGEGGTAELEEDTLTLTPEGDDSQLWNRYDGEMVDACASGAVSCNYSSSGSATGCSYNVSCTDGSHGGFSCSEEGPGATCTCVDFDGSSTTCTQTTVNCDLGWEASCCNLSFLP